MTPQDLLRTTMAYTCYVGMETDLIFNKGIDLPGFAAFPLLESAETRALVKSYAKQQVGIARLAGMGTILETPTWMANADRAAPLGYVADQIPAITADAIALMRSVDPGDTPVLISTNLGPRADAYTPSDQMTVQEARTYHMLQIKAAADAKADLISGFTLGYSNEAAGIALAARDCGIPVVISFTVETDGHLPSGESLGSAIAAVDAETGEYPAYYMINCAHPDHFKNVFDDPTVAARVSGLVVNASRCSHAELDEAEKLDDGDPTELGLQMGALAKRYAGLRVFGGCCGTDARHMTEIARNVAKART